MSDNQENENLDNEVNEKSFSLKIREDKGERYKTRGKAPENLHGEQKLKIEEPDFLRRIKEDLEKVKKVETEAKQKEDNFEVMLKEAEEKLSKGEEAYCPMSIKSRQLFCKSVNAEAVKNVSELESIISSGEKSNWTALIGFEVYDPEKIPAAQSNEQEKPEENEKQQKTAEETAAEAAIAVAAVVVIAEQGKKMVQEKFANVESLEQAMNVVKEMEEPIAAAQRKINEQRQSTTLPQAKNANNVRVGKSEKAQKISVWSRLKNWASSKPKETVAEKGEGKKSAFREFAEQKRKQLQAYKRLDRIRKIRARRMTAEGLRYRENPNYVPSSLEHNEQDMRPAAKSIQMEPRHIERDVKEQNPIGKEAKRVQLNPNYDKKDKVNKGEAKKVQLNPVLREMKRGGRAAS